MDWKIVISAVLLVVVLVIALNLRKRIERNKDSDGMFRPYKLRVEADGADDEENDEAEEANHEEEIDDYEDEEGGDEDDGQ